MAGIIEVKDQGKLRIYDADNSHYTDIVVPSSVTANRTITLPDASFTVPQADTNTVYTHPNHSGEVTSSADGATVIAGNVVDEANLKVSNSPTNGYNLVARSGNTGGMTWEAAASGSGRILQSVSNSDITDRSTTSSSFNVYSNTLQVAITPASTSSKILVLVNGIGYNNTNGAQCYYTVYRGSSDLGYSNRGLAQIANASGINTNISGFHIKVIDTPNTTNAVTYGVNFRAGGGTANIGYNQTRSTILLLEIGA